MLFLDFYDFGSLFLFLIDKVGIYLGGADVLVGKHLADSVDVCASGYEQCGVGVAEAMELSLRLLILRCMLQPAVSMARVTNKVSFFMSKIIFPLSAGPARQCQ